MVHARVACTLINIAQATGIVISTGAVATETINEINTNTIISARIAGTFVNVCFAVLTSKTRQTFAGIPEVGKIRIRVIVNMFQVIGKVFNG